MAHGRYTVGDVMTRDVLAATPTAGFKEVVTAMESRRVTAVPVVDGEQRVVGVVSEADLLAKEEYHDRVPGLIEQGQDLARTAKAGAVTVGELMTSPAITVGASDPLPRAARLMARHQVKRLPVIDRAGVLQGVVSRVDLLKVFLRADEDIAAEVRREVVDRVLPVSHHSVEVAVSDGVVSLTGTVRDDGLIPLVERLTRGVEGVVDVECALGTPPRAGPPTMP
ncbi:CBS domain-containing protein [Streptomyces sp. NPDC047315]|uniref:CBS domain-containing protein n=1 Tax=Streptomyces sp. NPDC047315 TaxID=3155142 RepID=UPI0033E7F5AB